MTVKDDGYGRDEPLPVRPKFKDLPEARGSGRVSRHIQPRRRNSVSRRTTATTSVPRPRPKKAPADPRLFTSQPKFWPKKPVRNDSGRNTVAMIVSRFITSLSRLDTTDMYASSDPLSRSR